MNGSDRRAFLSSLGRAGAFAVAGSWLPSIGYAQAGRGPVRAFLRRSPGRGDLDRRVLGSFLEDVYNLEDALLVGGFINTLLRNSDRVRVACLAQLVNVIAPLVTNETGVLRQSTYYPYSWALRYARGRVLDLRVESDTYRINAEGLQADFARDASVPFVDVVATIDDAAGQAAVLVLNRDLDGDREVVLQWEHVPTSVLACETLTGPDLKSFNTFAEPRRVTPQRLDPPATGSRMTFKLPPRSYTVTHLAISA